MNDDTKRFHEEILALSKELGPFLVEKNAAYGDATRVIVRCMGELFPRGVPVSQLSNAYYMIQVLNKLCRVAAHDPASGDPMKENPWKDAAGYSILAHSKAKALENSGGVIYTDQQGRRYKPAETFAKGVEAFADAVKAHTVHDFEWQAPDTCKCGEERDADCHPDRPFIGFHEFEPESAFGVNVCRQPDCEKPPQHEIHNGALAKVDSKHFFTFAAPDTCKCGDTKAAASHFPPDVERHYFRASETLSVRGRRLCGIAGCATTDEHSVHIQRRSC